MPLRFRIAVTIFVLEALLVSTVLFFTLRHTLNTAQQQFETSDAVTIELLSDLARLALLTEDYGEFQAFIEQASSRTRLRSVTLVNLSGQVVAASDPAWIGSPFQRQELTTELSDQLVDLGEHGARLGTLAAIFSDVDLLTAHEEAHRLGYAVGVSGMLIIAVVGMTMGYLLTHRLDRLTHVADCVARGDTAIRTNLHGGEEIARVGQAMDSMLDRLDLQLHEVTRSRDLLTLPTEAMHDGFAVWDPQDRLLLCNRRYRELRGGKPPSTEPGLIMVDAMRLMAQDHLDLGDDGPEDWIQWWRERRSSGAPNFEVRLRDGRWLRIGEWRMADGGTVSILTEITELKARERAHERSEDRLRAIMDSVDEGIATLDVTGRIQTVNEVLSRWFEQPAARLVGRGLGEFLVQPDEKGEWDVAEILDDTQGLNHPSSIELTGNRPSGQFPVKLRLQNITWRDETIFIATLHDLTDERRAQATILHQATHDVLTGLPNRALLEERLIQTLEQARRIEHSFAVIMLDIDRFKSINDTLGHGAGDELLISVAQRLKSRVRATDTVVRMSGDEFVLIFANLQCPTDAARLASELLDTLRKPFSLRAGEIHVTASLGIAVFPSDGENQTALLSHADTALYRAKKRGRNRYELFDRSMTSHVHERASLEADLRQALAQGDFTLAYQPQFDLQTGAMVGVEALIRWEHASRGNVPPDRFIPLAEDAGLICDIGRWVLGQACQDLAAWRRQGLCLPRLAVNVSARQLHDDLNSQIKQVLYEFDLDPHHLELEITETALLQESEPLLAMVQRIRSLGISLALDDFGTGYSSLSHLRRYPVQRLKIDRSFICEITSNAADAALASAVIALAKALNMHVVAEGIETKEQLDLVRKLGCDEAQGYLLGRPCKASSITPIMQNAA